MKFFAPVILLFFSNIAMTFAWYGHLKNLKSSPLWIAIAVSWGIALFEYCLQVPANRMGSDVYSLPQLKIIQEVITMIVFAGFSVMYMQQQIKLDYLWATLCMCGAAYFVFRG